MQIDMPNEIGWSATLTAILYNTLSWVTGADTHAIFTFTLSLLSFVYLLMRLYDKYLDIKEKRKKQKETKDATP
ncbi:hypothetical protein [Xanthovirga aplysinae]|uniref:hypothetical protein n=1 Tax=Xanthovirga aplysinae TaxID=2529853 RepID=UPI0012BC66EB|nr:hypothetical protein [Xanthovirga aplysinae]MTI31461.1 hypothetical protein [Xanthovirga aplysinae]